MRSSIRHLGGRRRHAVALAALLAGLAIAGCGGDNGDDGTGTAEQPARTTGPRSADEVRNPAPDDVISDRPGGPGQEEDGESRGQGRGQQPQGQGGQGARPAPRRDRRQIEASVRSYIEALNAHDGEVLCSLLAAGALRGVELPERRGSCAESLNASIGHRPPKGAPRWLSTRFVDADAVVLVRGGDGRFTGTVVHDFAGSREPSIEDDVVYLRREGARWLIVKPSGSFYRAIGARDVPLSALTPP